MERKRINVIPISGKGRGQKIGIGTYNFSIPNGLNLKYGIYAGWIEIHNRHYPVAIHFGPRPVFSEDDVSLEAHVVSRSLPSAVTGKVLMEFVSYLRPVRNFQSQKELVSQVKKDVKTTKTILSAS